MILDAQGRIIFVNHMAARVYARRSAREATGVRLSDLMPVPAAAERTELARHVIGTGEPVVLRDVWSGFALRSTFRRIDTYPEIGGPAAVIVCCLETALPEEAVAEPVPAPGRVVEAKHVDLGPLAGLTASELRVLALIGEGLSNAEIASRLRRAVKTVESHRAALTEKTGATSRVQLGFMARRAGLARRVTIDGRDPTPGRVRV
jgi:DNA-binding CsgD family transcriptional regulator